MSKPDFVTLAHQLADASGAVIRKYFRNLKSVEDKADGTAVTLADRGAEQAIREILGRERPQDAIWGEEYGQQPGTSGYRWVLDPVDGTVPFTAGRPSFGTIIGLEKDGQTLLGVVDQPITGERWIGIQGQGAFFFQPAQGIDNKKLKTSEKTRVEDALLGCTGITRFTDAELATFRRISKIAKRVLFGGDAYGYACLASGWVDLIIETDLKLHDYCGLLPIIREAGGVITDWQGGALDGREAAHVVAAATPELHAAAIALLNQV